MDLNFRCYSFEYSDAKDIEKLRIIGWGLNKNSEPVCLRIEDFYQFCFVELPPFMGRSPFTWSNESAEMLVDTLRKRMGENGPLPHHPSNFGNYKKLYYYSGGRKFPAIRLIFRTSDSMRKAKYILEQNNFDIYGLGPAKLNVWNDEIDPVRKMLTACSPDMEEDPKRLREVTYSGWTKCHATPVESGERISTLEREYIVPWSSLQRVPDEICDSWSISIGCLSWDIETYSNRHLQFPDKNNHSHVAYMISCIYTRLNSEDKTRYRYGIVLGECSEIPDSKLENVILFQVNTEEELVRMMGAIIKYHDPEVLTGYNILGFDYPYLDARLGITGQTWPQMSRLKNQGGERKHKEILPWDCYLKSNSWGSAAYGHNEINMLVCPGRISVDMLNVIKRTEKLPSYGLGVVAMKFVGKNKHPITAKEMFVIFEEMIMGIKARDKSQSEDNYEKETSTVTNHIIDCNVVSELMKQYNAAMKRMTEVMLYCIQDSELVLDIMDNRYWWLDSLEVSGIVGVNIIDLSTRGQQIRCLSQLYHVGSLSGYILNNRIAPDIPFEGGAVQPPTPGLHKQVLTIDFTSLYPSIMRRYNICYTTLIPPESMSIMPDHMCEITPDINCSNEVDPDASDDDEEENTERFKAGGKKGTYRFKYVKKDILEGLVPKIEEYLCSKRNIAKKLLADEYKKGDKANPTLLVMYDKRQNGLKISANSFFGFLGVREGGKRPLIEGAMSITSWGRQMIEDVIKFLKKKYNADIIYGDTDSAMISMPDQIKCDLDCYYWGDRIALEVTALFEKPINMEFEKAFLTMMSLKKKKYLGILGEPPNRKIYGEPHMRKSDQQVMYCCSSTREEMMVAKRTFMDILCFIEDEWESEEGEIMYGGISSIDLDKILGPMYKKFKNGEPEPFIRGVMTARRDNCLWTRDIYSRITLEAMMSDVQGIPREDAFRSIVHKVCDHVEPLLKGLVPVQDLCISRSLGASYKSQTYFMKVFSDCLRAEGTPAQPGDRLEYIVMSKPGEKHLGKRMMLKDTYGQKSSVLMEDDPILKIDYPYYLEKQLQSHVDQAISICYKKEIEKLSYVNFLQSKRHRKLIDLNSIVLMMARMTLVGDDIGEIRRVVDEGVAYIKSGVWKEHTPAYELIIEEEPVTLPSWLVMVDE